MKFQFDVIVAAHNILQINMKISQTPHKETCGALSSFLKLGPQLLDAVRVSDPDTRSLYLVWKHMMF